MATLKDIAIKANLSVPTVSRILSPRGGHYPFKPETIARVHQIAKHLNYIPNAAAQSLATNKTGNIALVLDTHRNTPEESTFWSPVMSGILRQCRESSISCIVSIEDYYNIDNFEMPMGIRQQKVDGFIITHPLGNTDEKVLGKFIKFGLPFVVLSWYSADPQIWSVCCEPSAGYHQACRHLAEFGHRKIGYCVYPVWHAPDTSEKIAPQPINLPGYDINFTPILTDTTKYSHREMGQLIAEDIINGKLDITALVVGDIIAIQIIETLAENNIKVPEDISIIGTEDTFFSQLSKPKLTCLRSPLEEMGTSAVTLLTENINGHKSDKKLTARHLTLPKLFVARDSTGPVSEKSNSKTLAEKT
jgi:LacI family transcriptional regulator, galactose operon repressor